MISNGPSRTFTREAVETWLTRLSVADWEKNIPKTQLREGRKFYREGKLSTIDLQTGQAIVTQKINREETYSVIEWNDQKPEIRTSVEDEDFGVVLATAGLYEIEELIAEIYEDDPLLDEVLPDEEEDEETENHQEIPENENTEAEKENKLTPLLVLLEVSNKNGLTAIPLWQTLSNERIPAYGEKETKIEHADRPALMRFVAEASERGFEFDKAKGVFLLRDWKQVATLTEDALPRWEKAFTLEFSGDAHLLRDGQRMLSWEIEARSRDSSSMTLRENFRLGSHRLGLEHSRKITKARNGTTFIRGHGLVHLDQNQLDDFEWWQRNRGDSKRANWPRYMLFSIFARKYLRARQDGKLADWQASIRQPKSNGIAKRFSFLRPYQKDGVAHLHALHKLGCHGLLADEMGLGKTVQTLALLVGNKEKELPDLVTCPASVVPVWIREAKERFPKLKVRVLNKETQFSAECKPCLWVASYTQLRRHRNLLETVNFRYAVLDEAQLIKNPKAKVTQTCLSINARHRLALSGTPIENTALDLWTIFRFLMPGLLGSRKDLEKNLIDTPDETAKLLRRQVTPFVLRRVKSEVATELPPKLETELPCPLNDEQRKEYRKLTEGAIAKHGEDFKNAIKEAPTHIFSLLTRLRQTCCDLGLLPWRANLPPTGTKGDLLIERLNDLSVSGAKVIVFSQFTSFLSILKKNIRLSLPDLQILELTGSTRDRSLPVETFESSDGPTVMLASLKAAGLGVTLKSADYVFLMDPWWNPAVEEQAIDRAHRLGRVKPTFIYRMVAQGTIEERVRNLQVEKKETFQKIIGEIEKPTGLADHFSSLKDLIELKES
jgi:SNF2 family DNA or RNA helicase